MGKRFDPVVLIASLEQEGYRRADIARASNLARSSITRLANGEFRRPSYETATALQRAADHLFPARNKTEPMR
jgi:transcriptional regulator with XRE-family HTH domain